MPLARLTIARVSRRSRWIWSRVSGRLCGVCLLLLFRFTQNWVGIELGWANHCLWFCLVPLIGINTVIIVAKLIWWSEFCSFLVARFYLFQNKNSDLLCYKYTNAGYSSSDLFGLLSGSWFWCFCACYQRMFYSIRVGSATRSIDWSQGAEYCAGA